MSIHCSLYMLPTALSRTCNINKPIIQMAIRNHTMFRRVHRRVKLVYGLISLRLHSLIFFNTTDLSSGDSRKQPSHPTQPNGSRYVAEAQGARARPTAHGQTATTAGTHTTPKVDLKEAVKQAERQIYELAKVRSIVCHSPRFILNAVQAIPRETVYIVFKMVLLRFRNRMIAPDSTPVKLASLESEQNLITPGMVRMCDIVAAAVQVFGLLFSVVYT